MPQQSAPLVAPREMPEETPQETAQKTAQAAFYQARSRDVDAAPRHGYGSGAYPQVLTHPQAVTPVPRRNRVSWVVIIAALLVSCCALSTATVVFGLPRLNSALPAADAAATPARSPERGDPPPVAQAWVRERIMETLAKQAQALVVGDERGYLAVAGAQDRPVRDQLRRQFASLRAMKVAAWQDELLRPVTRAGDGWTAELVSYPCFVAAPCDRAAAASSTTWSIKDGTAVLVGWRPGEGGRAPYPWQVSSLVAKAGRRTLVASTSTFAKKLPTLLKRAEEAAKVADRFARGGAVPDRYLIYYAGAAEWRKWFGWSPPDWSAGVAIRVGEDRYELVLNAKVLRDSTVDDLLRHEMTHASTLPGPYRERDSLWWLVEGVAELAELDGMPSRRLPALDEVGRLLRSGKVRGLAVDKPGSSTDGWIVDASYGMAYLAVRCITERYGEPRLVELFHRVVHDGVDLPAAADEVLDTEWQALHDGCMADIKRLAG